MNLNNIYFYLKISPWPIMMTLNLTIFFFNMIFFVNNKFNFMIFIIIFMIINNMILWIKNIYLINFKMNYYNNYIKMTKKIFLLLFIISEMMFFISFFYINFSIYYFNNMMYNFNNLNMFNLNFFMAFINSMILINSSLTFMYSLMMNNKFKMKTFMYINMTMMLSIYFILIQIFEFKMLNFNISHSILFSNFFMLTSFHMFHVLMGLSMMYMLKKFKLNYLNLMNLEFKMICIYWHFIDLIWIFIFLFFY